MHKKSNTDYNKLIWHNTWARTPFHNWSLYNETWAIYHVCQCGDPWHYHNNQTQDGGATWWMTVKQYRHIAPVALQADILKTSSENLWEDFLS